MTSRMWALTIAGGMVVLAGAAPRTATAQSLQRWSVQASGEYVFPVAEETDFETGARLGFEGQIRYTFSRFSLGAGYQRSTVFKLTDQDFTAAVSLGFLEPRYVVAASSSVAFYLAGRLGLGSLVCSPSEDCAEQSLEVAIGGGGGLLFLLSGRVSLDLGSQYFSTRFTQSTGGKLQTGYVLARLGIGVGL